MNRILIIAALLYCHLNLAETISTVEIKPALKGQSYNDSKHVLRPAVNEKSEYSTNLELRSDRKLGAGVGLLGVYGYMGGVVDINFEDQNAAQLGFGRGYGFNTFFAGWKHSFEGPYFSPYTVLGYSRWYSSLKTDISGNSYIVDQVLSSEETRQGQFGIDFATASVGMQYHQLSGEWIGNTFFLEFNFLLSLSRSFLTPAASVGTIYYF